MREMKDSGIEWIGEIPVGWDVTLLSALFKERKCKNKGMIETNLLSLSYGNIKRKDITSNEGLLPDSYETYNIIENGNIVFRLTDLHNDKRSLRTGLCKERGIITSAYITLELEQNDNPAYMYYLFHTYDLCKVFYGMGDGVRQGANYEDLKKLRVIRPSSPEQHRISTYLDTKCEKIDSIIARQQEVIEKLKAYKLSVITEAVTKGLNPDARMKNSGVEWIGDVPEHWEIGKIKNFCELKTGGTPSTTNQEWFDGKIQWFTPGDFSEKYILNTSSRNLSQLAIEDGVATLFPEKTVMIVGIGATAGKIGFSPMQSYCNQQITALITNSIFSKYLMYWMIANTKFLRETAMFTTLPILNNQTIGNYLCVIPKSITEQQQIADYLDKKCSAIDSAIAKKQAIIEKLTAYKKSLIYEVVTGKREV